MPQNNRTDHHDGANGGGEVILGVDTHRDVNVAALISDVGALIDTSAFPTTQAGYEQMLTWARAHGYLARAGVEGTSSYGAALSRHLRAAGVAVIEVNRPDRAHRRLRGKSDTLDAESAARAVLSGRATGLAKSTDGRWRSCGCSTREDLSDQVPVPGHQPAQTRPGRRAHARLGHNRPPRPLTPPWHRNEQVFDTRWMVERPVNESHPGTGIPLRPMGSIPVLARLVDAAGTERWIPARANRWTRTHVLVTWLEDPSRTGQESSCWLTARDVTRQLSGPSGTLAPWWTRLAGSR